MHLLKITPHSIFGKGYLTSDARNKACAGKYFLLYMRIFIYIVWCQFTNLHQRWRHFCNICLNLRPLKSLVTYFYKCQAILWHDRTNVRILPDGKVFTCRMPYINTVQYYLRNICRDRQFVLSITYLTLIYLRDYPE